MVLACRFCRPHNLLALKRLPLQAVLHRQTGRFRVPSCLFQPKGQPVLQRIPHHANTQPQRGKHNLPQSKTTQLAGADLAKRKKAAPCCHEAALNTATGPPLNGLAKTKRPRQQTWRSLLLPFYPFTFLPFPSGFHLFIFPTPLRPPCGMCFPVEGRSSHTCRCLSASLAACPCRSPVATGAVPVRWGRPSSRS